MTEKKNLCKRSIKLNSRLQFFVKLPKNGNMETRGEKESKYSAALGSQTIQEAIKLDLW